MKRRDSLKALTLGSLGAGLVPGSVLANEPKISSKTPESPIVDQEVKVPDGRQKFEATRDAKLLKEKFFTDKEMAAITILVDIIIPKDDVSGSATEAKVPDFIEFIVKDMPNYQTPLRGGLSWLNIESNKRFGKIFGALTKEQQLKIVDDIAYPEEAKPEFAAGVSFFSLMRNLTATGFYTTEIGIKDMGYVGNTPNVWNGPPEDVLKQYGFA